MTDQCRVALINPPFLPNYSRGQRSPAVTRSGTLYYPIWLAYAAAHVRRLGHIVDLVDAPACNLSQNDTLVRLHDFSPELVIVETATPSIDNDLDFIRELRRQFPQTPIFACGTHVSALPDEVLAATPQLTGLLIGEYEIPLENIIVAWLQKRSPAGEEGVFLAEAPAVRRSRFYQNLDARPFVSEIYREFLPIERYFNPNAHHPTVMIVSGRGCPYHCSFCVFPQTLTGHVYRCRSIASLLDEFDWVSRNLPQVRGIFLEDDTFTADAERAREFARCLSEKNLPLSWTANARADVDAETLKMLKKSRLRALCVGFESGSQMLLDRINKGLNLATMERFAHHAAEQGIHLHGCFIVGLPGETRATMQQTLQFALRLPLDTAQFYPLMVYPGTRGYEEAKRQGFLAEQDFRRWLHADGTHRCVVRTIDASPDQLVKFCNRARRRFYLRKSYLWRMAQRVVTDSEERHRIIRSARTFFRHLFWDV